MNNNTIDRLLTLLLCSLEEELNNRTYPKGRPELPNPSPMVLPERRDGKPLTQRQLKELALKYGTHNVDRLLRRARLRGDYRPHGLKRR